MDDFFVPVIIAAAIGGAGAGLLGVYVVGMRIPLVSVCMAHAALVGAVFGLWAGGQEQLWALAAAVTAAVLLGLVPTERLRLGENTALAVLFSVSMGLVFLGMGLNEGPKTAMLSLLWGNVLFVDAGQVRRIIAAGVALAVYLALFRRQMKAILFSRALAASSGVHETFVYTGFLGLMAFVVTVNLQAVGGLMLFSLMVNPAAAAYQLCRGYRSLVITGTVLGAVSAVGGFYGSCYLNRPAGLPTGACMVMVSALIFGVAALLRYVFRVHD